MIQIGIYNDLEILRDTSIGLYLGDKQGNDVLLPWKDEPEDIAIGDVLSVFVYKDSEDRLIATTKKPFVLLNEFAFLEVKQVNRVGAFLDWGLVKDLLVPFREQPQEMLRGRSYVVFMYHDKTTDRLVASGNVRKFLNNDDLTVSEEEEVDLMVYGFDDIGINVVINNTHRGLLYKNEIFTKVEYGDRLKGYIKKIRDDNKIDVVLQKQGYAHVEPNAQKILSLLKEAEGFLFLNDKSSPEDIKYQLQMSKKTFKKAIGALYKQKLIRIESDGIYLV